MQICPNCAYNNRPGVVFCENCGTSLIGSQATAETKSLDKTDSPSAVEEKIDVDVIQDAGVLGSEVFPSNATLRIEINDGSYVLKFNPQEKDVILFGRTDPSTGVTPQVDLTPYAGYRMGVSRRHAEIRKSSAQDNTLEVWDLGSSNGTFLNGERMISHRPYVLSDGDEIQLGQLRVRAFFQKEVTKSLDPAKVEALKVPEPSKPVGETVKVTDDEVKAAVADVNGEKKEPVPATPPSQSEAPKTSSENASAPPSQPKPVMPAVPNNETSDATITGGSNAAPAPQVTPTEGVSEKTDSKPEKKPE